MKSFIIILLMFLSLQALQKPIYLGLEGKVYDIEEKDMYKTIEENFYKYSKEHNITKILKNVVNKRFSVDTNTPYCKEFKQHSQEYIYKVKEDIIFKGRYIAKKGQEINILKKMPLNGYIIFSNYSTKEDKDNLIQLIAENKNINLRVNITKGNVKQAQVDIAQIFPNKIISIGKASKVIIDKFKIKCVPSIIFQQDYKLIINEMPIKKSEDE